MNEDLAQILRHYVKDLPFVDKITGIVRTGEKLDLQGKPLRLPIALNEHTEECLKTGRYMDLLPNSEYKSVLYFEERGEVEHRGYDPHTDSLLFSATLRLICWLNTAKLNVEYSTAPAILAVIRVMPHHTPRNGIKVSESLKHYNQIKVTSVRIITDSSSLFTRYSYMETRNQYLLYPYAAFGIDISLQFGLSLTCLPPYVLPEPLPASLLKRY